LFSKFSPKVLICAMLTSLTSTGVLVEVLVDVLTDVFADVEALVEALALIGVEVLALVEVLVDTALSQLVNRAKRAKIQNLFFIFNFTFIILT